MEPLEIASKLKDAFPDDVRDVVTIRGLTAVRINKDKLFDVCRYLRFNPDIKMEYLMSLCGADYYGKRDPRFEVVYNLYSFTNRCSLRLRASVSEDNPRIASVTSMWIGAGCQEREVFDLFGIEFEGHPDMSRVLMPEDWEGHPLRKDYPLRGPEKEWQGYAEVKQRARELSKHDFYQDMLREPGQKEG